MNEILQLERIADNVFRYNSDLSTLEPNMIDFIKNKAIHHTLQRARINFHNTDDDTVQEMIIAMTNNTIVEPHCHKNKCESFHIIEGTVRVGFLDSFSEIESVVELGGKYKYYRLNSPKYHIVIPITKIVVVHEVTKGPFVKGKSSTIMKLNPKELNLLQQKIINWQDNE